MPQIKISPFQGEQQGLMLSGFGHKEIITPCYWQTLFWDLQERSIQLCPPPHLSRLCYRTSQFWTSQSGLHLNPFWSISSYIILCDDQHHWQVNSQQLQEFGGYPTDHKTTWKTFYETKAVQNQLDDTQILAKNIDKHSSYPAASTVNGFCLHTYRRDHCQSWLSLPAL